MINPIIIRALRTWAAGIGVLDATGYDAAARFIRAASDGFRAIGRDDIADALTSIARDVESRIIRR